MNGLAELIHKALCGTEDHVMFRVVVRSHDTDFQSAPMGKNSLLSLAERDIPNLHRIDYSSNGSTWWPL